MTCNTCGTPYGEVAKDTSESRPTWVCVNGHRQAWGEDVAERPAWIDRAAEDACGTFLGCYELQDDFAEIIEKHWRAAK